MRTGGPISSSFVSDRLLDLGRFDIIFSFNPLNSANNGVEGNCGDADALRACRTTFGERRRSAGGYVADLGAQGNAISVLYGSELVSPCRGEDNGFEGMGGTGVRNLSLGLRVKASGFSELLQLCPSMGTSKTLRRWPGNKGQKVVEGSVGL